MPKLIIGLVGPLASGKGVVKEYLCKKYNAKSYKFSSPIRDILRRIHTVDSRENMQNMSYDLRKRFGEDILAKTIAKDAKEDKSDVIVIDGARRLADITHLQPLPEFKLISIDADIENRFKRVKQRKENPGDSEKTLDEFKADELREAEQEIPKVMAISNYQIDNNSDFSNLYGQIDKIIAKMNSYDK